MSNPIFFLFSFIVCVNASVIGPIQSMLFRKSLTQTLTTLISNRNMSSSFIGSKNFTIEAVPAPGSPFHLAIPVHDLNLARHFYGHILELKEGRRAENKWQDYSLNGHQIVCHYVGSTYRCADYYNPVDGDEVPVPHFGAVLSQDEFHSLAARLEANQVPFIVKPHLRFAGQPGEQWTMFFKDPSNNNLEFKAMTNPDYLFARYNVVDGE